MATPVSNDIQTKSDPSYSNPQVQAPPCKELPFDQTDWTKVPASNGITLELCAGIIDNAALTPAEIAKQEVWEECGYNAPLQNFKHVSKFM